MNNLSKMAIMGLMTAGTALAGDSKETKTSEGAFKVQCEAAEGKVSELKCKGTSSCHGKVLHENGQVEAISCSGKNSCKGILCLAPKAETSEVNFKASCEKNGGKIADVECKGHNKCAGVILQKGAVSEVACNGANSCKGVACHVK